MKKIIFMLCLLSCFIGFSNKRSMINFMRSHNRHLSFEESSFIYDVTMHYASIYKVDPVLVFSVRQIFLAILQGFFCKTRILSAIESASSIS